MTTWARITVRLTDEEWEALVNGAKSERRDPRDQAGLFVREGLERAGYLAPSTAPAIESFGKLGHPVQA